jgi:hypothetical protein
MNARGSCQVSLTQAYALARTVSSDLTFSARKNGDRKKMMQAAMECKVEVHRGFDPMSPLYDIIERGHKLVHTNDDESTRYFNKFDSNGLNYNLEGIYGGPNKTNWQPFKQKRSPGSLR